MEDEFKEVRFDELNFSDLEDINNTPIPDQVVFRDPVVRRVVYQFIDRSNVGYNKYGKTLDDERRQGVKDLGGYLQDVQEELMDAILYIQAAKEELADTPPCKCNVKDAKVASAIKWKEERNKKTTIGDLKALNDLKSKMDAKKQSSYYGCDHGKNGLPYYMTDVAS